MAQILVRDLDDQTVDRLKARARRHGRSLQGEVKAILEAAAPVLTLEEAVRMADSWQRRLAGTALSDSADLIREDRDR